MHDTIIGIISYSVHLMERRMSKPGILHVIKSVLAAAIGVQSEQNRKIDFERGSLSDYLVVGAITSFLFILSIVFIVSIITSE